MRERLETTRDGFAPTTFRDLRRRHEMTQAELAQLVGVTQAAVGHIEVGRKRPSIAIAVKLAAALGVTVDALLDALPAAPESESPPPPDAPQQN